MHKKSLFEDHFTSNGRKAFNIREVSLEDGGDLRMSGHDFDPDLEQFVGNSSWQGTVTVAAADVGGLRDTLQNAFPSPGIDSATPQGLLDLIHSAFGGKLTCMTDFAKWMKEREIKFEESSYS